MHIRQEFSNLTDISPALLRIIKTLIKKSRKCLEENYYKAGL